MNSVIRGNWSKWHSQKVSCERPMNPPNRTFKLTDHRFFHVVDVFMIDFPYYDCSILKKTYHLIFVRQYNKLRVVVLRNKKQWYRKGNHLRNTMRHHEPNLCVPLKFDWGRIFFLLKFINGEEVFRKEIIVIVL